LALLLLLATSVARADDATPSEPTSDPAVEAPAPARLEPRSEMPTQTRTETPTATISSGMTWPSRHELSVQVGYQAGFGGALASPSGLKVTADYGFRFHRLAWFDLQLGNVFGAGSADGVCSGDPRSTCYRGGWDFNVSAGVRVKLRPTPTVAVEIPVLVGVSVLYQRDCGDNGAALPVFRPGLRAVYFLTPRVGLGAGVNLAVGPAFHGGGCGKSSYTTLYGAFDFSLGAEFLL